MEGRKYAVHTTEVCSGAYILSCCLCFFCFFASCCARSASTARCTSTLQHTAAMSMQLYSMPMLQPGQCHSISNTDDMADRCNDSNQQHTDQPESSNTMQDSRDPYLRATSFGWRSRQYLIICTSWRMFEWRNSSSTNWTGVAS